MSLDFILLAPEYNDHELFSRNITHNLGKMARECGVYDCLWRPDENGYEYARDIIEPLTNGLALLESDPVRFSEFNSPNGWGLYENFVPFVRACLEACKEYPNAKIYASR